MSRSSSARGWALRGAVVAALAGALGACVFGGEETPAPHLLTEGEYQCQRWDVTPSFQEREPARGYPTTEGRTLRFDRAARRVTVRFVREGRVYVETWRVRTP